ncbi:hypothetical protein NDU88_003161 [Pleurodeles waltl]|uniref:Uncharacterized protein n=1 Tax=Pleurodeles waltl TaxID=8319 RepID=A0AAV7W470_PLEWA|nr:hypothetical protein NDU88_003161 [Pleurodeles waltl]
MGVRALEHGAGSSRATHSVCGSARSYPGPGAPVQASPGGPGLGRHFDLRVGSGRGKRPEPTPHRFASQ